MCATVDGQCLEYLGYITLGPISKIYVWKPIKAQLFFRRQKKNCQAKVRVTLLAQTHILQLLKKVLYGCIVNGNLGCLNYKYVLILRLQIEVYQMGTFNPITRYQNNLLVLAKNLFAAMLNTRSSIWNTNAPLNPNWHETGYFYLLVILGLDFVS